MSEQIRNQGPKPDRLEEAGGRLNRRNTFAWIIWGLVVPIAFIIMLWVFWLLELI